MSNDETLNNAEEAPQNDALEQTNDNSESIENTETDDNSSETSASDGAGTAEDTTINDKGTASFTPKQQESYLSGIKRAKAIGARQGESEAMRKLEASGYQTQGNYPQQNTDPNKVYDANTGTYIDKNMTIGEYENHVNSLGTQQSTQQAPINTQQQPQGQGDPRTQVTDSAMDQLENALIEKGDDFKDFMTNSGTTFDMVNVAGRSQDGVKVLYELYKSDPQALFKMSRQDAEEQKYQVRKLLEAETVKAKKKLVTQSIPQPEPLKAAPRSSNPDMSLAERKAAFLNNEG